MSLVSTPNLCRNLQNANLLIDTCTIIDASKCPEVENFLHELSSTGCTFLSIPPVKDEFTCMANSPEEYKQLSDYIDSLQIILLNNIERENANKERIVFNMALSRCKNIKPSYVDRAILSIPYLYRNSSEQIYIISSNHKDIPDDFFDRIGFITHDIGGFHNIGVYKFNIKNFQHKISDIKIKF